MLDDGGTLNVLRLDDYTQIAQVEDAITLGAEALVVAPTDASALNPTFDRAKEAGIPEVDDIYVADAIPEDLWFQVNSGEALIGLFRYDDKSDALYVANRNAYAPQDMAIAVIARCNWPPETW